MNEKKKPDHENAMLADFFGGMMLAFIPGIIAIAFAGPVGATFWIAAWIICGLFIYQIGVGR